MFALIATPLVAVLLGFFVPVRKRWLIGPYVLLAVALTVSVWFAWDNADEGDLGQAGSVMFVGVFAAVSVAIWAACVTAGAYFRRRRANSAATDGSSCT